MDKTPQAVEDCHKLLLWIIPQLDKFPRNRRFTLGERIESGLLSVLEHLLDKRFIDDSYACRKNKGVYAAVDRYQQLA